MFIETSLLIIYRYYLTLNMDEVVDNLLNSADLIYLDIVSDMIKNEGDMINFLGLGS